MSAVQAGARAGARPGVEAGLGPGVGDLGDLGRLTVGPPTALGPSPVPLAVTWRGVAGATGARLSVARVVVDPDTAGPGDDLGVVVGARSRVTSLEVEVPQAGQRLRALTLPGLVHHDGEADRALEAGLGDLRLVVAPVVRGAVQAPIACVPPVRARGAVPAQLAGAHLVGSVLELPDLAGGRFVVTLCRGDDPASFERVEFSHGDVRLRVAPYPGEVTVTGPAGEELLTTAGSLTDTLVVDVRAALERHLSGRAGGEPAGALGVRAAWPGAAWVGLTTAGETIERSLPGRHRVEVAGPGARLEVPSPAARAPRRTRASVSVEHHGMALHPLSGTAPVPAGDLAGPVVGSEPVVRALPEQALRGSTLRRVAVLGRVLDGETDLVLDVLGAHATAGALTGHPGPGHQVVWFDLGSGAPVEGPVELALRATRGRFGWLADPEPRVWLAVASPPEGRTVVVGGARVALTGPATTVATVLEGPAPWGVATDEVCTVALTDVVQEFAP